MSESTEWNSAGLIIKFLFVIIDPVESFNLRFLDISEGLSGVI